jgi:homoserine kinase type II
VATNFQPIMSVYFLDVAAREVLACYAGLRLHEPVEALGNHGGFSGVSLWRVNTEGQPYCLRAWPAGDPTPARLRWLHQLMEAARQAGLAFVPSVLTTAEGTTGVVHLGRLWELGAWMPGRADFHQDPTEARLAAACVALAQLHQAWAMQTPVAGQSPGLQRRLDRAEGWLRLMASGWRPSFATTTSDPVTLFAKQAWGLLPNWVERVPALLAPWTGRSFALHPCLCDIWHDHVLYEGERVSGLIDYGSVRIDHAAVDLARLLGSLAGDDAGAWRVGLEAYTTIRPLTTDELALTRALDQTGTALAAAAWLRWLYHEGRPFPDRTVIAARLEALVRRLERWG